MGSRSRSGSVHDTIHRGRAWCDVTAAGNARRAARRDKQAGSWRLPCQHCLHSPAPQQRLLPLLPVLLLCAAVMATTAACLSAAVIRQEGCSQGHDCFPPRGRQRIQPPPVRAQHHLRGRQRGRVSGAVGQGQQAHMQVAGQLKRLPRQRGEAALSRDTCSVESLECQCAEQGARHSPGPAALPCPALHAVHSRTSANQSTDHTAGAHLLCNEGVEGLEGCPARVHIADEQLASPCRQGRGRAGARAGPGQRQGRRGHIRTSAHQQARKTS